MVTLIKDPTHGIPFAAPDAALGAPWVSYELGLSSNAGELIAAVNVSILGPLHQRWEFDADSGVFHETSHSAILANGDSHFLQTGGLFFYNGPYEDNSGVGSPLADTPLHDYGVGTFLTDAFGFVTPTTTASIAYLVVPESRMYDLDISVLVADPLGNIISTLDETDFFPVPEPGTLSLFGWSLVCRLGVGRRKRPRSC